MKLFSSPLEQWARDSITIIFYGHGVNKTGSVRFEISIVSVMEKNKFRARRKKAFSRNATLFFHIQFQRGTLSRRILTPSPPLPVLRSTLLRQFGARLHFESKIF